MLGFFRGKGKRKENKNENIIYTPCKGTVVPITDCLLYTSGKYPPQKKNSHNDFSLKFSEEKDINQVNRADST